MNYININNPEEFYLYMLKYIKYGFIGKQDKDVYIRKKLNNDELYDQELLKNYYLQSPSELVESGCGLCTDQVELERDFLKQQGYEVRTFYSTFHNHTFLLYKDKDNKYVLFERTYNKMNGLKKFDSLDKFFEYYKALQKVVDKSKNEVIVREYNDIEYGLGFNDMIDYLNREEHKKVLEYK